MNAPVLPLHNGHIQKWCRWRHWLAERERRWLGMAFWAAWHDDEVAAGGGYGSE